MIEYLKTTSIILGMVFVLSLIFAAAITALAILWPRAHKERTTELAWPVPALITAPFLIVIFYLLTEQNLMFPSLFDVDLWTLFFYSLMPALVLLVASGIVGNLWRSAFQETKRWQAAPFYKFSQAMGLSAYWTLGKLVYTSVLVRTWMACLPWVFGELIIVEAMFNAPGLGLDIWHFAKVQDTTSLLQALSWLVLLYGLCFYGARQISLIIGERLRSYA